MLLLFPVTALGQKQIIRPKLTHELKKNNNVVTGRATEGGTKFERGSRGGAEKESGWSSG